MVFHVGLECQYMCGYNVTRYSTHRFSNRNYCIALSSRPGWPGTNQIVVRRISTPVNTQTQLLGQHRELMTTCKRHHEQRTCQVVLMRSKFSMCSHGTIQSLHFVKLPRAKEGYIVANHTERLGSEALDAQSHSLLGLFGIFAANLLVRWMH